MPTYRDHIRKKKYKPNNGFVFNCEAFQKEYPSLFDFLSRCQDDKGKAVEPGWFKVYSSEGELKVVIGSPQDDCVGFKTLSTVDGLFDHLDHWLVEGEIDWQQDKFSKKRS